MKQFRPVVLIIMDGFGVPPDLAGSPLANVKTPIFKELEKNFPFTTLQASGIAVGLPWGEAGNSEVGHLTIGAGRIIYNYLPKISNAINDGDFFKNPAFLKAINNAKEHGSSLHFLGLFSTGTVHAYFEHLYALLELTKQQQVSKVFLHLFTDGKDSYKKEGAEWFKKFEDKIKIDYPNASIASIIGRNFAMDRDGNMEKTQKTFDLFVNGNGDSFDTASDYIQSQYDAGFFDESINPALAKTATSESRIKSGDSVIFFNFREDSMRQITKYFLDQIPELLIVTMTQYDKNFPCDFAFESAAIKNPLAKIISENNLTQLHAAETEKYAHITYFLNGGEEKAFNGEERVLVPSPETSSFEFLPEMSADKVVQLILNSLNKFDFIAVNFANADMVGHTGNFEATTKAMEKIGECVAKLTTAILEIDGVMIVTADHGNAEEKIYKLTGRKKTEHSINPVPFYLVAKEFKRQNPLTDTEIQNNKKQPTGTLSDIAPTILELLNLKKPPEMTGENLVEKLI